MCSLFVLLATNSYRVFSMLDITNSTSDDAHWENPPDFIPKVGKCCHKDLPKGHRCHICCCWQRTGCIGNVVQLVCWPLMFLILLPILTLSNLVIWAFVYGCRGGAIGVAKSGTQPYCKMLYIILIKYNLVPRY